jgi:tetratricopeptide (TPR) repeat protein
VQETDPHRLVAVHATRAAVYYFGRDFERAAQECEKALQLDPRHFMLHYILGRAYARLGKNSQAVRHFDGIASLAGEFPLINAARGLAYAIEGKKEITQKLIDGFQAAGQKRYIPATYFGILYAGMGDRTKAMTWLEKAYEERADGLTWLGVDPMLDSLRADPQFNDLVRRIGLAS